jgi:hypothetical protein
MGGPGGELVAGMSVARIHRAAKRMEAGKLVAIDDLVRDVLAVEDVPGDNHARNAGLANLSEVASMSAGDRHEGPELNWERSREKTGTDHAADSAIHALSDAILLRRIRHSGLMSASLLLEELVKHGAVELLGVVAPNSANTMT